VTGIITYISILTVNINRLISPMKRHRLANWAKKEDPTIFCLLDAPYWQKEALAASERLEEDLLS
jgi:hypothetical protein